MFKDGKKLICNNIRNDYLIIKSGRWSIEGNDSFLKESLLIRADSCEESI